MAYFKIGSTDFSHLVSGLKVGHETLVSESSGRASDGNMVMDIIGTKYKIYVTFRSMTEAEAIPLFSAIGSYVQNVSFQNPVNGSLTTINAYTSTPEPEWYWITTNEKRLRSFTINFIEM